MNSKQYTGNNRYSYKLLLKVVLKLKGREMIRREENKKSLLEFITMLDDVSLPESLPKDEGNRTTVILKKK